MTTRPLMRARLGEATEDRITVEVDSPAGRQLLEYRSPDPVWHAPPTTLDFAAVSLVQYAASSHCDLALEGEATRQQLERLDEFLMIWSTWRPDLFEYVSVVAEHEIEEALSDERAGAVMGFSGGVDAAFALATHKTGAAGRLTRDIDLGVLVVGWDLKHADDEGVRRASESARRALEAYGVELAVVSTNWQQDFCRAWFMTFSSALAAILHTFSERSAAAVHATDRSYLEEMRIAPYGSHMSINHLLGHPGFPVVSTGGTHTRLERIAFLGDHPALLRELRVCYQPEAGGGNCGRCEKCVRTQLELRATGLSAAEAFPTPMTADDLRSAEVHRPSVLQHYDNVLARLTPSEEYHEVLSTWLQRQRSSTVPPRVRQLSARVSELERELVRAREEIAALQASRSWRVTSPLRRTSDRLRRRAGEPGSRQT